MARGIIKHLKRMYAPKHWMLDKLRPGKDGGGGNVTEEASRRVGNLERFLGYDNPYNVPIYSHRPRILDK